MCSFKLFFCRCSSHAFIGCKNYALNCHRKSISLSLGAVSLNWFFPSDEYMCMHACNDGVHVHVMMGGSSMRTRQPRREAVDTASKGLGPVNSQWIFLLVCSTVRIVQLMHVSLNPWLSDDIQRVWDLGSSNLVSVRFLLTGFSVLISIYIYIERQLSVILYGCTCLCERPAVIINLIGQFRSSRSKP